MRIWTIAPLLALAGCTTTGQRPDMAGPCRVDEAVRMRYVGTKFRMEMRESIERDTRSRVSRILRPGDQATMDLRPDRLNIHLDDYRQIDGLRCG